MLSMFLVLWNLVLMLWHWQLGWWILVGEVLEQQLLLLHMHLFSLPLPLWPFEWSPGVLSYNLLNLTTCLTLLHLCLGYLGLERKAWHSLEVSWSDMLTIWLMQMSLSQQLISMVLLMAPVFSFCNCFSGFLIISKLLDVLIIFFSLLIIREMPTDKSQSENLQLFP